MYDGFFPIQPEVPHDPSEEYNFVGSQSLCVSGLPSAIEDTELRDFFKATKGLIKVSIIRDSDDGRCLGYGYAVFETAQKAEDALMSHNFKSLHEHTPPLMLRRVVTHKGTLLDFYDFFVDHLHQEATVADIVAELNIRRLPEMDSIYILKDAHTDEQRPCAFLKLRESLDFPEAYDILMDDPIVVRGQLTKTKTVYQPLGECKLSDLANNTSVFIPNLGINTTPVMMERALSTYGHVLSMKFIHVRRIAFATFRDHISALAALSAFQNEKIGGLMLNMMWARGVVDVHGELQFNVPSQTVEKTTDPMAPLEREEEEIEEGVQYDNKALTAIIDMYGSVPPPPSDDED